MTTAVSTVTTSYLTPVSHGENSPNNGMASRPPPSSYLTIDGLLRQHAAQEEEIPMIGYPVRGIADYEIHTVKTVDRYIDAACWWYQEQGLRPADPRSAQAPVVALLTQSGLDAIVSFFAFSRMGWAVLFLSTRLTAPAYVSLMKLADSTTIVAPPIYNDVLHEMQAQMSLDSIPRINASDYRSNFNVAPFYRDADKNKESRKTAWIIHSSGSTGFPKPIFITNFGCLANWRTGLGFRSFTVSPLFHSHALMEFGRAIYTKRPIFFGNYSFPVTRNNLIAAMKVANPEIVCAVPYVLKLLAEKNEGIVELAKAKIVMYGGSACPDSLGDELVSKGVVLAGNYGATETGFIMNSFRPTGDNEWNYLRLHKPVSEHVLMDEIAPGLFECVALDGLPSKVAINSDSPPNSFRTKDLFYRHPDPRKSNYWKYASRLDDRLTLVNGEKVLPIPIEGHVRQHELVKEAAVFGIQRSVPGMLVWLSEHASSISQADALNRIWPHIEEANSQAESFSRIPKDLVILRPCEEEYPKTDKGTIIRAQVYAHYNKTIEDAYEQFESGGNEQNRALLQLDVADIEQYLLAKFRDALHVPLDSIDTDIFSAGVDSLQTTRIWNLIKKELDLGGNQAKLSPNIVFEKGTVRSLAQHLHNLRLGIDDEADSDNAEIGLMQQLIQKYSNFTPHEAAGKPSTSSKTVLLTGVTGGLGSILLAKLLHREDVTEVYCLVRAASEEQAHGRVISALEARNLHTDLSSNHLSKITAVNSDLSLPNLSLSVTHLSSLLSKVTHIIHSAWAVNFNLSLASFEAQHIRGVYNLIENIALRTTHSRPASFYFCSSISAASGTPKPATIREVQVENLLHAQHMGYGRSKLVAEHITHNAMKNTGMLSRTLRIGQLAGDTKSAYWNDTEAIALMIRSALPSSAGCLPSLDETPSWLPVDVAAKAIEQIAFDKNNSNNATSNADNWSSPPSIEEDLDLVYHILNPRSFSFQNDLLPMLQNHQAMPNFDIVDAQTWLERLQASEPDVERNPSRKLIEFWEGKYGKKLGGDDSAGSAVQRSTEQNADQEAGAKDVSKGLIFETVRTVQDGKVLGTVGDPVSDGLMERIVGVWMEKWTGEVARMGPKA